MVEELGLGILDAWVTDNETVSLVRRGNDGKRRISQVPYSWYFLLNFDDYRKIDMEQWKDWRLEGLVDRKSVV